MISPSQKDYSYIEVSRPIIGGCNEFVARVRELGRSILGEEVVASIAEVGLSGYETADDELTKPTTHVIPIKEPILKVSPEDDLCMVLLRRSVPSALSFRYDVTYNVSQFKRTVEI